MTQINGMTIRPPVAAFARLMELHLRKNDSKPGWKDENVSYLVSKAREELEELTATVFAYGGPDRPFAIAGEGADLANFVMMIVDVCGGLDCEDL